jgi:hypothetical protein
MRRFSYSPVGGKTQSAKSDHDARHEFQSDPPRLRGHCFNIYISSLVSDKFDRVFSLFFQKLSLRMAGHHKVQSRHTKRQRNRGTGSDGRTVVPGARSA